MKKRLPLILLLGCVALFIGGVLQLFRLRFEQGDIYPPYSSLRADPIGTMALYESFEQSSRMSVRRDFSDANRLPEARDTTYLQIAAQAWEWDSLPDKLWKEIDGFLINGGRLVITLYPETGWDFWTTAGPTMTVTATNTAGTNAVGTTTGGTNTVKTLGKRGNLRRALRQAGREVHESTLEEHWGVEFGHVELTKNADDIYEPAFVHNATTLALPKVLDWHSAAVFTNLNKAWQPIYTRGKSAVMIERKFGAGSVVLATDSFFLSNEAMRDHREPQLLAWLVGTNHRIFFDESHFGIVDQGGIATLIRKYRLHGLALALLALAGLFIWKSAASLVPPVAAESAPGFIAGKDSAAGFVNLLRRNVPVADILNICFAEWTKSLLLGRHYTLSGVDQAQVLLEEENARVPTRKDPIGTYRKICAALSNSKFRRSPGSSSTQPPVEQPRTETQP